LCCGLRKPVQKDTKTDLVNPVENPVKTREQEKAK
jgi:hypothetical protein